MAEGLPPPTEQPPASSSSSTQSSSNFWQLISGVANDLDLMLHDLFPDASLLAGAAISPDDPLLSHASILEQLASSTAREGVETDRLSRGGSSNPPSPAPPTPPPCPDPGAPPEPSPTSSSLPETTATTATTSEEESTAGGCEMGLLERLIRTHPVWFLPSLGRAGATHLLQGREVGCFIVRSSSKPGTMALSVRLPLGAGPHVEHYLLESAGDEGQIRLEGSQHQFHAIPTLVCHYCQCCDELPAQLCLPPPLMQASSRQELSSLALLGQDFWLSTMVNNSPSKCLPPVPPGHTIPPIANKNSFKTASLTDLSTSTSPPPIPLAPKPRPTPPPPPPPRARPPPAPSEDEPSSDHLTSTPKKLHYKKSNIIKDGYFASSLADKISDYEDIWYSPSVPQSNEDGKRSSLSRVMISQETQTEMLDEKVENNSSLFYSEPIDSVNHNPPMDKTAPLYRFSDPSLNGSSSMKTSINGDVNDTGGVSISSSFENLSLSKAHRSLGGDTSWLQELKSKIRGKSKENNGTLKEESLPPSSANTLNTTMNRRNWTLDSSWEWLGNEDSDEEGGATVHEIIVRTSPELQVSTAPPPRLSDYDNLEEDESGTEVSEPWDLAQHWESLLKQAGSDTLKTKNKFQQVGESDTESVVSEDSRTFQERLEPLLAAQRVVALRSKGTHVGENIRNYVFRLAEEKDNTFAKSIENFIQCTKESMESNPAVTMRNIRQFMTGMKNYLVKHGEGQFEQMVQQERSKLKADEFLNIDAILEGALHRLVIKPLKTYIYQLFVSAHSQSGALRQLSDAIKFARARTPQQLGIRPGVSLPSGRELELVGRFLNRLQRSYSPLRKLENLLAAIAAIYSFLASSVPNSDTHPSESEEDMRDTLLPRDSGSGDKVSCGAEEFMPVFMWSVARCGLLGAEIEADYMWALLHPSLLAGEAGYYLAALSSAVQVLKALPAPSNQLHSSSLSPSSTLTTLACGSSTEAFLKVMIPDELTGSLLTKTLPIRPNMTTRDVGKMIAHKFRITNPQDYGLFRLVKGEEIQLQELECPHQLAPEGGMFAYKRCDARFVWPVLPDH